MGTEAWRVDRRNPDEAVIARAVATLREGGLVAFPTETVYGLGADALRSEAVHRIFVAKGRPANNPLIVHVADVAGARAIVADWPPLVRTLVEKFWPGPLTLVLPKREAIPDNVTAGGPTVAIRVPQHPVALALLRAFGSPIAAPSANRSTAVSPTRGEHVLRGLDGRIDLLLDAGPTERGIESTVLDVTTTPVRVLRPGPIAPRELQRIVGPTVVATAPSDRSPGQMRRHYAPSVPVQLAIDDGADRVQALLASRNRVGWLSLGMIEVAGAVRFEMPNDPEGYARQLYACLHELENRGVERIVIDLPPEDDDWLAVHDRLRRTVG